MSKTELLIPKLENIISGHNINHDDADWLRAALTQPAEPSLWEQVHAAQPAEGGDVSPKRLALVDELIRLAGLRDVLHSRYQGRVMDGDTYEHFTELRDVRIPELRAKLAAQPASQERAVYCTTPYCRDNTSGACTGPCSRIAASQEQADCDTCKHAALKESQSPCRECVPYSPARPMWASQEQAQQPSEPHLFEFWWETHMPRATQAEAWAAWQGAHSSKGSGIEAQQPSGGEVVDERASFIEWMTTSYPKVYRVSEVERYWEHRHVSALAWLARATLATPKPEPMTRDELDRCRQWFDCIQDVHGGYLDQHNYALAKKLYTALGMRVPSSITKGEAHG